MQKAGFLTMRLIFPILVLTAGFWFSLHQFLAIAHLSTIYEPGHEKNLFSGLKTRYNTNRAEQPQNIVRGLKFRIKKVEELYYLCSGNKGADKLHPCRPADLSLIFCIYMQKAVLS